MGKSKEGIGEDMSHYLKSFFQGEWTVGMTISFLAEGTSAQRFLGNGSGPRDISMNFVGD